ncbi:MAG: cyanoexosortase A system-associated protein [Leptolyngbyaceae cyanobacterium CRU_2_3]|nr:cyanoexosortase A system-associated protein [Leptolyngbyaceae cyanobacterium CRU_2_3]
MTFPLRLPLLQLACLSIFLTLSKLVLDPVAGQRPFAPFSFPRSIPISGWQLVDSQPLGDRRSNLPKYNRVIAGQQYLYQQTAAQKTRQLEIEVRYVVNTDGNIFQLIKEQKAIALKTSPTQVKTNIGIYSRFTVDQQTHLTSCINPRGTSTVTSEQFLHNRYTHDGQLDRLFAWSLGQNSLLDKRCLWVDLSMSAETHMSKQVEASLEKVWRDWMMVWQPQFPHP